MIEEGAPQSEHRQALFVRLPDAVFQPLAGPSRWRYAELLTELVPLFFDEAMEDLAPTREAVLDRVDAYIAESDRQGWEDASDDDTPDTFGDRGVANRIYRRLLASGWMAEERDGYRVTVLMPPAVGELLAALQEIQRGPRVFVGGAVQSIYNNVESAARDPENQVAAFHQAADDARRFGRHLGSLVYGLKDLLDSLAHIGDRRKVLANFFDDFVERFLVADYKRLKTENNPFRFRSALLQRVREIRFDAPLNARFVQGYLVYFRHADGEQARVALERDLGTLERVFEGVDASLERIDRYRLRFERRVADAVRYLDRSQPGMAGRVSRLLEFLGRVPADRLEAACEIQTLLPLYRHLPLATSRLYQPRTARKPVDAGVLRNRTMDPEALALQKALRDYLDRRRIDPRRIERWLDAQMGAADSIPAAELRIAGVEDYIAYTHLRHLASLAGARSPYRVEPLAGKVTNDYVITDDFVVYRRWRPAGGGNQSDGHAI